MHELGPQDPGAQLASPEPADPISTIRDEIKEFATNCGYRAECQITASGFWGNFQLILGAAAAGAAALAGASAFAKHSIVAGAFAVAAAVTSGILATVKAGERAAAHEHYANELNLVSEAASRLYELGAVDRSGPDKLLADFDAIVAKRDELMRKAPFVNRRLCRRAAHFLAGGDSYYSRSLDAKDQVGLVRRRVRSARHVLW
jgi:hypothetical protein